MSHQPPPDPSQPRKPEQAGPPSVPFPTRPMPPASGPSFQPGYASLPPPQPENPPTTEFPAPPKPEYSAAPGYGPPPGYGGPGYGGPGYGGPGYGGPGNGGPGYGPPPPRRSSVPLIVVILAVTVLLCGGVVTAGVMIVQNVADRAKEAVKPITDPSLPALPTEVPNLPTDLPQLPTNLPDLPDNGRKITVVYEVTGDGPAEIVYTETLGESPQRVSNAKLPWKLTTTMEGATLVSVTAIRSDADSGTISCRATVDGEEVARRSGEGAFATASCFTMILN